MQKRRTSFYIYIAVMAVLTIALAAFRTVTLAQSISGNMSLKVFSEAFYTSDTVYKISIPVFTLLSALVLIFVRKKKTVMLSPTESKGGKTAALICGVGFLLCGIMMFMGWFAEVGKGGIGLLNFARLLCVLLIFPCGIYFLDIFFGFLKKEKIWLFALCLPVWASLQIVTEYFNSYFAFHNPIRASGNVALACAILFLLPEARANLAYPCGRFFMAITAALPCLVALHILPLVLTLPLILHTDVPFFSFELLPDMILLPLLIYMTARCFASLKKITENN